MGCPQYLSCLTTSRSVTDKLAFDVGLQKDAAGEGGPRDLGGTPKVWRVPVGF